MIPLLCGAIEAFRFLESPIFPRMKREMKAKLYFYVRAGSQLGLFSIRLFC